MPEAVPCAVCKSLPAAGEPWPHRPLVPARFLEQGVFDIDPLGTGGAAVPLCPGCLQVMEAPMLLAGDVEQLAKAVELHGQAFPPSGPSEALAARARLWHRAVHLGLTALIGELLERPVAPAPRPEPAQLGLFVSKTARLSTVERALSDGDFDEARLTAADLERRFDLPEARYLAARLGEVVRRTGEAAGDAAALARMAAHPEELLERSRLTVSLLGAFSRGLYRKAAAAAESAGLALVGEQPRGWLWLQAQDVVRARQALEEGLASGGATGKCLVLRGNMDYEAGEQGIARERYRRAFAADPEGIDPEAVADAEVAALFDEAAELELEPSGEWLPMVGFLVGVFALPTEPDEQGKCRAFHEALRAARKGDIEGRRTMKNLAPRLFERLLEEGRL